MNATTSVSVQRSARDPDELVIEFECHKCANVSTQTVRLPAPTAASAKRARREKEDEDENEEEDDDEDGHATRPFLVRCSCDVGRSSVADDVFDERIVSDQRTYQPHLAGVVRRVEFAVDDAQGDHVKYVTEFIDSASTPRRLEKAEESVNSETGVRFLRHCTTFSGKWLVTTSKRVRQHDPSMSSSSSSGEEKESYEVDDVSVWTRVAGVFGTATAIEWYRGNAKERFSWTHFRFS